VEEPESTGKGSSMPSGSFKFHSHVRHHAGIYLLIKSMISAFVTISTCPVVNPNWNMMLMAVKSRTNLEPMFKEH